MLSLFKSPLEKSFHNRERLTAADIHHDMVVFHTDRRSFTVDIRNKKPFTDQYLEWMKWIATCSKIHVHDRDFFYNNLLVSVEKKDHCVYIHNVIQTPQDKRQLVEWTNMFTTQGVFDQRHIVSEEVYCETDSWLNIMYSQYIIQIMKPLYEKESVQKMLMTKPYAFSINFLYDHMFLAESMQDLCQLSDIYERVMEDQSQELALFYSSKGHGL